MAIYKGSHNPILKGNLYINHGTMLINHLYTKVDLSGMILQVVEDHFVVDLCHSLKAQDCFGPHLVLQRYQDPPRNHPGVTANRPGIGWKHRIQAKDGPRHDRLKMGGYKGA